MKEFNYIGKYSADERPIFVLDEYSDFARSYPELSSVLQAHIDHKLKTGKLLVDFF